MHVIFLSLTEEFHQTMFIKCNSIPYCLCNICYFFVTEISVVCYSVGPISVQIFPIVHKHNHIMYTLHAHAYVIPTINICMAVYIHCSRPLNNAAFEFAAQG